MAATAPLPGARSVALHGRRGLRLEGCLAALDDAIAAADGLGLDVAPARAVRDEAERRLGVASDVYVLALVGGTGVGKSSLLNALAGRTVTASGVRRPTTSVPVAWVATSAAPSVASLLDQLGPVERRLHHDHELAGVVVLDLPDVDSFVVEHRAVVDALLPRMDAVAWVLDPEKYADALLHDELLRTWIPRLDHQLVILNKADRLPPDRIGTVLAHLERVLGGELAGSGAARPAIVTTTAHTGAEGITDVRAWLDAATDAKAIVLSRIAASAADAVAGLARMAGVAGEPGRRPAVDPDRRRRALDVATAEALRVLDLAGAERQAVAATRAAARRRGAGPLRGITSLAYRLSGRERRVADPALYLADWRSRGSLARAAAPVSDVVLEAIAGAPAVLRPALAAASDPGRVERRLAVALDRAVAVHPVSTAPTSRAWTLLGLARTVSVAVLVVAVAWLVLWVVARPPVATLAVPYLGAVPMPFALVVAALVAGFVPARLLAAHAGWLGRRWARRLAADLRAEVSASVGAGAFAVLDRVEASRRALWIASRAADEACGPVSGSRSPC
jgi:hypothetical protein